GSGTLERLAALEVPARALDARWGGGALERAVASARGALTPARADFSRRYAEAMERGANPDAWLALADAASSAPQPDIELGALFFAPPPRLPVARSRRLALATADPWFAALADEKAAAAERRQGEPVRSLERLTPIESRCMAGLRVEDRCATVERA